MYQKFVTFAPICESDSRQNGILLHHDCQSGPSFRVDLQAPERS